MTTIMPSTTGYDQSGGGAPNAFASPGGELSGYYFYPIGQNTTSTSSTLGNNTLRLQPTYLPGMTIEGIGGEITVIGDSTSVIQPAIYADNGHGIPGALLSSNLPSFSGFTPAVQVNPIAGNLVIPAGWYWLGGVLQGEVTLQPTVRITGAGTTLGAIMPAGSTLPSGGGTSMSLSYANISGALPTSLGLPTLNQNNPPRLIMQLA